MSGAEMTLSASESETCPDDVNMRQASGAIGSKICNLYASPFV